VACGYSYSFKNGKLSLGNDEDDKQVGLTDQLTKQIEIFQSIIESVWSGNKHSSSNQHGCTIRKYRT